MAYEETDWRHGLSPEVRDQPIMERFKTPEEMAKSYISANALITNGDKLVIPKTPDDPNWGQVFNRLGRPEEATGYKVPEFKDLPEGFTIQEEQTKKFLELAHAAGLSQKQVETIMGSHVTGQLELFNGSVKQRTDAQSAGEKALKTEWGTGYDANFNLADKALQWAGGKDSKDLAAKYGADPAFIRMMAKIGNEVSEDLLGPGTPKPGDLTPASAQEAINVIMRDTKHAYHNANDPGHVAAVEHVSGLFKLTDPGQTDMD